MVPFVGRQPELAVLRARLADALAGRPQIVQIQGPAGIGKTALLDHFLGEAGRRPAPVVIRASGEETEELLAYGVVEQLRRSMSGRRATGAADATESAGRRRRWTGWRRSSSRGSELVDDPVTVGTRLLEFLDRLGGAPVILAVDDAQLGRPAVDAGADLRAAPARRRPGADHRRRARRQHRRPAGEPGPAGQRAAGHGAAAARAGRGGPARPGRGDGHRGHRRGRGAPAAVRDAGKPVARPGAAGGIPAVANGARDDQLLPSPRSFRRLVQDRYASCAPTDPPADRRGRRPRPALPAAAGRRAGRGRATRWTPSTRRPGTICSQVSEAESPWTVSFPHPLVRAARLRGARPGPPACAAHRGGLGGRPTQSAVLRHRVAAAAEPDEALAADLTRFADCEARRQSWQSAAAHLVSASRLSPDPSEAQRRVLRAVVWTMFARRRRDGRQRLPPRSPRTRTAAARRRARLAGHGGRGPGDGRGAARPRLGGRAATGDRTRRSRRSSALMTAIHWYGRLDAAATVDWCERALAAIRRRAEPPDRRSRRSP